MAGLFDTFTIAKRGLSVNQSLINTTSHNISNSETEGYSRQRSVAATTTPSGGDSKFDSCTVGQVGTGSQITAIQRIRDTFIDTRVRNQKAENGSLDVQDGYLQQVEDIIDETSDTGIQQALSDFYNDFSTLSTGADKSSNKTVAIGAASTLASRINDRYNQLKNKMGDAQSVLKNDVNEVNEILDQITTLNGQIKKVSTLGLSPNDLMDKRDNLLDSLSEKMGITVTSDKNNTVGVTANEDTNAVGNLVNSSDTTDKITSTRFSYFESAGNYDSSAKTLTVTYSKLGDSSKTTTITISGVATQADADSLKKDLENNRILITDSNGDLTKASSGTITQSDFKAAMYKDTEKGEIGGNQKVQKQIQTSMNDLDTIAKSLAYTVNAIQTGSLTDGSVASGSGLNSDLVFVADGTTSDTGINASNIRVNSVLQNDSTKLNCGLTSGSGEKDGTRAASISQISSLKINYTSIGDSSAYTTRKDFLAAAGISFGTSSNNSALTGDTAGSTMNNYYVSALSKVNTKAKGVSSDLTTAEKSLTDLVNQRTSVSGVSIDEETTNLIEYQHAYQANAKVISTINELLDVVINGLKA
ncbi:flagellar hook-associated protein FlgK [Clostridium beijerinckii]|uniref:flagellar hook-associated protein FlgK n=1 Tax=Clostridium beijerinckii TaxID=1520 RepID=UPI0015715C0D|nr:flagellar hook-associated protein FlgK [Clostridium beijerinckii]NRT73727.1 flagellar hook-associated protein 1 FlgK [Clostridium beijerinckii]